MTQVDLETLVTACAYGLASCDEAKVACETAHPDFDLASEEDGSEIPLPDYAPGSFWLSKDAEYDWFNRNAFFERNDSNSHSANLNPNVYPPLNQVSNSQRFLVNRKSKALIIRLPKPQKTAFAEAKNRKPPGNTRLFLNKARSTVPKPDLAFIEPGSPKVSCIGRVRSKRDRNRRRRIRNKNTEPIRQSKAGAGLLDSFRAMFRSRRGRKDGNTLAPQAEDSVMDIRERVPVIEADGAPSLGGMKRFASGRKSDTWAGDVMSHVDRRGAGY